MLGDYMAQDLNRNEFTNQKIVISDDNSKRNIDIKRDYVIFSRVDVGYGVSIPFGVNINNEKMSVVDTNIDYTSPKIRNMFVVVDMNEQRNDVQGIEIFDMLEFMFLKNFVRKIDNYRITFDVDVSLHGLILNYINFQLFGDDEKVEMQISRIRKLLNDYDCSGDVNGY